MNFAYDRSTSLDGVPHPPPGALAPVDIVRHGSIRYCRNNNRRIPDIDYMAVSSDPRMGGRIAVAYLAGPILDPLAVPAYRAFRTETAAQFEFLTRTPAKGGLGVQVEVRDVDPYPDAIAMTEDLRTHGRLAVFATAGSGSEHPFLTDDENDMFRAVHDAFGHAAIGRGFDRHGEEAAWVKHATMYSPLARQAMTTDTRGQTSTFIYYYQGRCFPEQKVMILPERFRNISGAHNLSATRTRRQHACGTSGVEESGEPTGPVPARSGDGRERREAQPYSS